MFNFKGALFFHLYFGSLGFRTWMFLTCNSAAAKHHQLLQKVFWGLAGKFQDLRGNHQRGRAFRCKTPWFSLWDLIRPSNFGFGSTECSKTRSGPVLRGHFVGPETAEGLCWPAALRLPRIQCPRAADPTSGHGVGGISLAAAAIPRERPLRAPRRLQADAKGHHPFGSGNPNTHDFAGDVVRSLQTETWHDLHHFLASLGVGLYFYQFPMFPLFNVSVFRFDKRPLSGSTPSCREPRMPRLVRYSQSLKW